MIRNLFLAVLCISLTACLITVDSDSRPLQTSWDESEVARLEVGRSDREYVRTTFGDPATRLSYADGTEVWKYRNRSEKDTEVGVFLVFAVDVEEERIETLSIEFADGIVSNYWIEDKRF